MIKIDTLLTDTRIKMFKMLECKSTEQYEKMLEDIAWWYLFALENGYAVSATKEVSPLRIETLELPIELKNNYEINMNGGV